MAGYKIPKQFQDEDKWFRFFTKKQLLFIGVPLVLTVFIVISLWQSSRVLLFFVSIILSIIDIACILFSSFKMPTDKYLWGGGTSLEKLGIRLLNKQSSKKKVLWVKNYGDHKKPVENKIGLLDRIFKFED